VVVVLVLVVVAVVVVVDDPASGAPLSSNPSSPPRCGSRTDPDLPDCVLTEKPAAGYISALRLDESGARPRLLARLSNVDGETKALVRQGRFVAHRDPACPALFQEDGKPLTIYEVNDTWTRAFRAAGLPLGRKAGYTIQHLRHTFVSEAHKAGETAGVIMA